MTGQVPGNRAFSSSRRPVDGHNDLPERALVSAHPRFFDPCFAPNPKRLEPFDALPAVKAGLRSEALRVDADARFKLTLRLDGFPGLALAGLAPFAERVPAGRECLSVPALALA